MPFVNALYFLAVSSSLFVVEVSGQVPTVNVIIGLVTDLKYTAILVVIVICGSSSASTSSYLEFPDIGTSFPDK